MKNYTRQRNNAPVESSKDKHLVFLLESNEDDEQHVVECLESIGLKYILGNKDDIAKSLDNINPSIFLIDITILDKDGRLPQAILDYQSSLKQALPVVFTSSRDNIEMRLHAIRAGGSGFITKPIDVNFLSSIFDIFVPTRHTTKYKVLVVDDDKSQSDYCIAILNSSNMEAVSLNEPLKIFEKLIDFEPEVILTDMHMPDCSGSELAKIIRQHQGYSIIPIVFISGEESIDKQVEMRSIGADDFIIKPFKPIHLAEMVYGRAQRYRYINSLIQKDGLTGLLQYNKVKNTIDEAIDTARRHGNQLTCTLIDLDHFKRINDTHGHLAGDRVLRRFASLLLKRLRKGDIVTRYGGEEFLVVLPFTGQVETVKIIDEIRKLFVNEEYISDGKSFRASFSAGISSIDMAESLTDLIKIADNALYQAKEEGRSKTVVGAAEL